jgi:hypothetical protein
MSHASVFSTVAHCFRTLSLVVVDLVRLASVAVHSHSTLEAENLFLRKQLALEVQTNGKASLAQGPPKGDSGLAAENPIWGEERIANELKLKLGSAYRPVP